MDLLQLDVLDSGILIDTVDIGLESGVLVAVEVALDAIVGEEPGEADNAEQAGQDWKSN